MKDLPQFVSYFGGGCWPTPSQRLLLRACLLQGEKAQIAWSDWRALSSIDLVDAGSFRLMPLLYANLTANHIETTELPRLRGVYRYFWSKHKQLVHFSLPAIKCLNEAGIPVMLIKGAALNITAYADKALRPMSDIDVLIPHNRAREAIDKIESIGWTSRFRNHHQLVEVAHACHFIGPGNTELDLHWHLLHSDCSPQADRGFWDRSIPNVWNGIPMRVPSTADQLLHACEHGPRYNLVPPLRWLSDATLLIKQLCNGMEWDCLSQTSREKDITLPVLETLHYLRRELDQSIPESVLDDLNRVRPSLLASIHHRVMRWPTPRGLTFWNQLPSNFFGYLRWKRSCGYKNLWRDLFAYLGLMHNLDRSTKSYIRDQLKLALAIWRARLRVIPLRITKRISGQPMVLWDPTVKDSDITRDVHALEQYKYVPFRWTKPYAKFTFATPVAFRYMEIQLPPIPAVLQGIHDRGFYVLVNGQKLSVSQFQSSKNRICFNLPPNLTPDRSVLVLELRVATPFIAQNDTRGLGLPLSGIRLLT